MRLWRRQKEREKNRGTQALQADERLADVIILAFDTLIID